MDTVTAPQTPNVTAGRGRRLASRLMALALAALGAALLPGGWQLLQLGGTPYYLMAGAALLACAVWQWRGAPTAALLYAALLAATLAWALSESGVDLWPLLARLGLWLVVAVPVLALAHRGSVGQRTLLAAGTLSVAVLAFAAWEAGRVDAAPPVAAAPAAAVAGEGDDWLHYGNDIAGTRYSRLDAINRDNVGQLQVAWRFRFGEDHPPGLQVTPLKVGEWVYACSASNRVVSLQADTGAVRWLFDPKADIKSPPYRACRGLAYYRVPEATGHCATRIYTNTVDARVIALDAESGTLCPGFGQGGHVSMLEGMGKHPNAYYYFNGAPTLARNKLVFGGLVVDNQKWGSPSGVIRALDAVTGQLAWAYDVAHPDRTGAPPPGETYTPSTPNAWGQMSYDDALGLVYVPTGNATPDYYGAQRRPFDEEVASSVMALDIETGRRRWVTQTVHHDLWDYDVGSQPVLVDLPDGQGRVAQALVQPTKRAELFLLDRATGQPLATVEERPVPATGAAPGERLSPTQPFSTGMPSFAGEPLSEARMWGLTPYDQLWCRAKFRGARYEGPMTPPGLGYTVTYPGYMGGMDWGSVSVDTDRDVMVTPANHVPNYTRIVPRAEADAAGWVPMGEEKPGAKSAASDLVAGYAQAGTPFAAITVPFMSPLRIPCNQPPWGTLHAVDLKTRRTLWSRPLGTTRSSGVAGWRPGIALPIGTPLLGGSLVTRGGLVFIAASVDHTFRAIDIDTGRELWSHVMPASGVATPMSYRSPKGRQFVVIAAGGHLAEMGTSADELVAFALPQ